MGLFGGKKNDTSDNAGGWEPCPNRKCSGGTVIVKLKRDDGSTFSMNDTCKTCRGTGKR
jgi:DnaJ-class molecular chaperone